MNSQTEEKNIFKDKVIAIGLTGGLAAYKICFLINQLKKAGASIRLIASENALNFITKTTLQTLAKTPVLTEQFDLKKYDINHKSLQAQSDLFILAPASANTISKAATGIADNLLTSILCAWQKPIIIAPAMNGGMWQNPATQKNIKTLQKRGAFIVGPQVAQTSSGQITKGPMADIQTIFETAKNILALQNKLKGKKVLIIGGVMREFFDKTNFISSENYFGKAKLMADGAYLSGAQVCLVGNEIIDAPCTQIKVQTCAEYKAVILKNLKDFDILIFAAESLSWQIIRKENSNSKIVLTLISAADFLQEVLPKKQTKISVLDLRRQEFDTQNPMQTVLDILENIK